MFNKRGQGLSVNAIIMIVLGVVVLAVLILGFTMGWKNIAPWIGAGNNVDTIVKACGVACGTQSQYDFCTIQRDLKDAEDNEVKASCEVLSKSHSKYGIKECPQINCVGVTGETVSKSLSEAKGKCIKKDDVLKYLDGDSKEQSHMCIPENLAKTDSAAKERCLKEEQKVQWVNSNNNDELETITCNKGDGKVPNN